MDTILDALQEGRLFELPDNDKTDALQFLAHIIEAFPEVPAGTDVVGNVLKKEEAANTALGKGWACPHAHVPFDEDLMCVIGWSPAGIDYGATDGKPVTIAIMYLVPENQRRHYLREISLLAKALQTYPGLDKLQEVKDLDDIRNYLLDLIDSSKESAGLDTRARMIRLQAKPAPELPVLQDLSNLLVESVTLVAGPSLKPVVLTQNPDLLKWLESADDLAGKIEVDGSYQNGGWRLVRRGAVAYQGNRLVFDCIAVKLVAS
ncbi:MAG TPA: PTS sugar transporter subunit IIA [Candidatus Hydrogenedentes bacterium]|jgi:mannitol/fructose-specific phosphotransferase system IIA component (Ntr-type)|nr:PTS sugar transporter subunit IIA [Candidatus Hydrogenedentota bacterium]HPJ98277.1 PTS sugar transporter subunit IIA [Candidatus Hydrogenedentota bacterium]